jgi:hypothetical protein
MEEIFVCKQIVLMNKGDSLFLKEENGEFKQDDEFIYRGTDNKTIWIEPLNLERKTKYIDENYIYLNIRELTLFRIKGRMEKRDEKLKELGLE